MSPLDDALQGIEAVVANAPGDKTISIGSYAETALDARGERIGDYSAKITIRRSRADSEFPLYLKAEAARLCGQHSIDYEVI